MGYCNKNISCGCIEEIRKSKEMLSFWKNNAQGWAPGETTEKFERARLDLLIDLTDCLTMWYDIGEKMTQGQIILAYANLGALVEGWLKLFYCVYYRDYKESPKITSKGNPIEPENLSFEFLIQHSNKALWDDTDYDWGKWVKKIQQHRNAIHAFNSSDIERMAGDYIEDHNKFFGEFIELIGNRLPRL